MGGFQEGNVQDIEEREKSVEKEKSSLVLKVLQLVNKKRMITLRKKLLLKALLKSKKVHKLFLNPLLVHDNSVENLSLRRKRAKSIFKIMIELELFSGKKSD